MRILIALTLTIISFQLAFSQIDISEARSLTIGEEVTVEGLVTNGGELGIIRYIQDETAGIAVYPGNGSVENFADDVNTGDLIRVTGALKEFNNLLEIDPVNSFEILSSGNPLPDPLILTPSQLGEDYEAQLVQLNDVLFENGGSPFPQGTVNFTSGDESGTIFLRNNHPLIGMEIPLATVNLTGICSQFSDFYQILPRSGDDISVSADFFFTSSVTQSALTTSGFALNWTTNEGGTTGFRYGLTPDFELGEMELELVTTEHSFTFTDLEPAQFYYVQVFSTSTDESITAPTGLYSTASLSSGAMEVYFNKSVDTSIATEQEAQSLSPAEIENKLIELIDAAENTIDFCAYNINRTTIVDALNDAHNRGVRVRYIANIGTLNEALGDGLPEFTVFEGNGESLMHNKFVVFDATSTENSRVWTGSMNFTDNNIATDFNNVVLIQDEALAKAYTWEFNEMWGSDGDSPGIFTAAFGSDKTNNTPQLFSVNETTVELYFSPSDNTTNAIVEAINSADESLQFAILSFTHNPIGSAVNSAHFNGVNVSGIIESINDTGSEFDFLQGNGVNVWAHEPSTQLHHKYAIIDANSPNSDPMVITGSHNWSRSAEESNDENTLIIHNASVANQFLQEFSQRWCEVTDPNCEPVSVGEGPESWNISIYPNPSPQFLNIEVPGIHENIDVHIVSAEGRRVMSSSILATENNLQLDIADLAAGIYFIKLMQAGEIVSSKLIKLDR